MKAVRICLAAAALVLAASAAHAQATSRDGAATMARLQGALDLLNRELSATFEQIKTLQATLEQNRRSIDSIHGRGPGYTMEQVEAARQKAAERERELQAQIDQAFGRIKEIDLQKQPLLRRLQDQLQQDEQQATQ